MPTAMEPCDGHWSPQRKTVLLLAIDYRLIPLREAATRFALSTRSWRAGGATTAHTAHPACGPPASNAIARSAGSTEKEAASKFLY